MTWLGSYSVLIVLHLRCVVFIFCVKQKTAYELRISDWSSDVCSSDLNAAAIGMLRFIGWWRRSLCKYGDRVAGHQHRAERQRRTNKSLHLDFLPPAWGVVRFMQNPSSREARL